MVPPRRSAGSAHVAASEPVWSQCCLSRMWLRLCAFLLLISQRSFFDLLDFFPDQRFQSVPQSRLALWHMICGGRELHFLSGSSFLLHPAGSFMLAWRSGSCGQRRVSQAAVQGAERGGVQATPKGTAGAAVLISRSHSCLRAAFSPQIFVSVISPSPQRGCSCVTGYTA